MRKARSQAYLNPKIWLVSFALPVWSGVFGVVFSVYPAHISPSLVVYALVADICVLFSWDAVLLGPILGGLFPGFERGTRVLK
jgi:hypothetical protein